MRDAMRKRRAEFFAGLPESAKAIAFSATPSPLRELFAPGKVVAGYVAAGSEADPGGLLTAAARAGCTLALPYVTSKSAPMKFLSWELEQPLENGPFGLEQPAASNAEIHPDVVLVPMIAFDRNLNRLGQGGGHYDRALSLLENAVKIGIAWSVQEVGSVACDVWDVPLDAILTEREWISR